MQEYLIEIIIKNGILLEPSPKWVNTTDDLNYVVSHLFEVYPTLYYLFNNKVYGVFYKLDVIKRCGANCGHDDQIIYFSKKITGYAEVKGL